MRFIKFLDNINIENNPDAFFALLPYGIKSKEQLLLELKENLKFPQYFGFNSLTMRT